MVTYYNRKDLIKFGLYLLSEERTQRIIDNYQEGDPTSLDERIREVYHADLENWKESMRQKKEHDIDV